jgi:hypothetical protein
VSGINLSRSEDCTDTPFDYRKQTADRNFSFVHSVNGTATLKVITVSKKMKTKQVQM